ncbi:hypothetical protein HU200_044065 [Digitaria exilis]|uniref:Uncharacterized protein n=1 Tax=Digitaria exilis TaxID=1010633 RepID=A0A835B251_9POAL|nr:hypothetical protein HU200_044065 [Digitaria exilis]
MALATSSPTVATGGTSTSAITAATVTGSHVLRINGYSRTRGLGVRRYIESSKFLVAGHTWIIRYHPNGWSQEYADSISLFLFHCGRRGGEVKATFVFSLHHYAGEPVPVFTNTIKSHTFSTENRCWGIDKFIPRAALERSYIDGDSFRIRCDVTVVKDIRVETTVTNSGDEPPSPDLGQNLGELLDSQLGADVEFMVGDEVFMAHRIVLAARSSVFKAELYGQMKEKYRMTCIQIDDMDPRVFKAMLRFIYTDKFPKVDKDEKIVMAQHLLVAADRYNLERLKVISMDVLRRYIDPSTAVATLVLAEQHGCPRLKEAVMESDDFEHLMRSSPSLFKELLAKVAP